MEREVRAELRPRYPELRRENDPLTVEEYEASLGPESHLQHLSSVFKEIVASNRLGSLLTRFSWQRLNISADENNLLLSDDPLIRTNGLLSPESHIAFPLTPKIAIFGLMDGNHFYRLVNQPLKDIVKQMNAQAVESARHFIVDVDESQFRFIRNRFGRKPRPTLSEASLGDWRSGNSQ
jgi:hypothetical protein